MPANPQVWQDLESGEISESYALDGSGIVFNLEGLPFKLPEFILSLRRREQTVLSLTLLIPALAPVNLLQLGELIPLPLSSAEIRQAVSAEVTLALKAELVRDCLVPAYARIRHLDELLQLRDTAGGHLILDFYNYELQDLKLKV